MVLLVLDPEEGPVRSFLLKVNGVAHCPGGISRPRDGDWVGGAVEISRFGPIRAEKGKMQPAGEITPGDELWIWTHETPKHGGGVGLCAVALAGALFERDSKPHVALDRVKILTRKIGRSTFSVLGLPSRVISHTLGSSHNRVYLLEGNDREEFLALLAARDREALSARKASDDEGGEIDWREALRAREDGRFLDAERAHREAAARPEQRRFRREVLDRYGHACLVTGCKIGAAIEAAHVVSHDGKPTWDRPENGIPLRRDLHGMFDEFLWSIDPEAGRVVLGGALRMRLAKDDPYLGIEGKTLAHKVPRPLLEWHFALFREVEDEATQYA
ncbi:HNH endonuclease [Cereibacter johrii]|uniref:HNH endonuclease n=1 Tax=Cereibacter johrii TaxID=445629 RepID=UPI003CF91D68